MSARFDAARDELLLAIAEMFDVPCNEIDQTELTQVSDLANELQIIFAEQDNRMINCNL